jgi:hypothetical protein
MKSSAFPFQPSSYFRVQEELFELNPAQLPRSRLEADLN